MIRVELLEWRNSIKLVGREITFPGMGFIANTKNRWANGSFELCLWTLKSTTIENDADRSNVAIQRCQSRFQFGLQIFLQPFLFLVSVSPLARVGQQIGFYFLNLTRIDNSSSNFPTKRWKRCPNVLLLHRCNLIDIDHLLNVIFLLSRKLICLKANISCSHYVLL